MTSTRNRLTVLTTVYPPMSSADAVGLMRVPEVEAMLRTSDFYMIAARAEARFTADPVHLLAPPYNRQLFANYPKGADGLHGPGYERYGYVIGEQMAFNTARGRVRGGVNEFGMITAETDAIFVESDEVTRRDLRGRRYYPSNSPDEDAQVRRCSALFRQQVRSSATTATTV